MTHDEISDALDEVDEMIELARARRGAMGTEIRLRFDPTEEGSGQPDDG